jgi:predicted Fe-Mo cluster-binding NifX family protein
MKIVAGAKGGGRSRDGRLAQHFGHCEKFALVDLDGKLVTGENACDH